MDAVSLLRAERRRLREERAAAGSPMSTATADDEARAGGGGGACGATRDDMPLELAPRHDINLEDFRVRAAPPALYYVPNAVTADEEAAILARTHAAPKGAWVQLKRRRLQNWGGEPGRRAAPLPVWVASIAHAFGATAGFDGPHSPNHVLINEYAPGEGIMHHTDGPLYHPIVAILSCGGGIGMTFRPPRDDPVASGGGFSLYLQPRSLFVFTCDAYHRWLHGIDELTADVIREDCLNASAAGVAVGDSLPRATRVSYTVRHVPTPPPAAS